MNKLKEYALKYFESHFIFLILISIVLINYFIYAKLAFLNFYNLPVIAAGYFLGRRAAVLGAFFIILMVWVYILVDSSSYVQGENVFDLYFSLAVWGGFLILSGALIGTLSQTVKLELENSKQLSRELSAEQELLRSANKKLEENMDEMECRVGERVQKLERSQSALQSRNAKVENALFSVMDPEAAELMIEGNLRHEKRRISVLFSDLKSFTAYSEENPPEKVIGELNSYLNAMEECITRYNGHVDKYIGDGIMVEFGVPAPYVTHSLMAVMTAISMQNRVKITNLDWQMRVGISTGTTVIGLFGSKRKSYSCIGDTPNLASRLEQICAPASIYIDEETYKDVNLFVHAERVINLFGQRTADSELEKKIVSLEEKLSGEPENVENLFALGQAYFKKRAASQAVACYEKILGIDPGHTEAKLAYAEASIKKDEFEKIFLKGKSRRVNVYEVIGLADPMLNRDKIPQMFYDEYKDVANKIKIPEEAILPTECIDGSIRHGRMVAIISYALADKMGLSVQEKEDVMVAGFLHDLGMDIIPRHLLNTPRKLTDNELVFVEKHPTHSVSLMKKLGYQSESLVKMVEAHHERYDGAGYPFGIKEDDIPVGGRIIAVADSFDSMTSKRMYAETWEYKSTIWEIQKDAAEGMYDAKVVEALKTLFGI